MEVLQLEPLDVFSIRSARPFDIGGVVHADFVWPPPPWTVLGALRGALSELLGLPAVEYGRLESTHPKFELVKRVLGEPDGAAKFQIGPVLPAVQTTGPNGPRLSLRWPVPADLIAVQDVSGQRRIERLEAIEPPTGTACSMREGRTHILIPPPRLEEHAAKSLGIRALDGGLLGQWLQGALTMMVPDPAVGESDFETEPRIGIQIDPERNTVAEGRFYVRTAVQLRKDRVLALPIVDKGQDIPWHQIDGHAVRFGADGHLVRVRQPQAAEVPSCPASTELHRARLLCVGPIHPDDIDALENRKPAVRVHAVAAGRPVKIGGWHLVAEKRNGTEHQRGPRTLRTYYPPGTVLYVESESDLRELHCRNLAKREEEKAAGFGFCLVGLWE
jgi:CRISPR type III-B/RAMP module-associated protein Cmr3